VSKKTTVTVQENKSCSKESWEGTPEEESLLMRGPYSRPGHAMAVLSVTNLTPSLLNRCIIVCH